MKRTLFSKTFENVGKTKCLSSRLFFSIQMFSIFCVTIFPGHLNHNHEKLDMQERFIEQPSLVRQHPKEKSRIPLSTTEITTDGQKGAKILEFDGREQFLPSKYPIVFSDIEIGCFALLLNEFQNNLGDRLFAVCLRIVWV